MRHFGGVQAASVAAADGGSVNIHEAADGRGGRAGVAQLGAGTFVITAWAGAQNLDSWSRRGGAARLGRGNGAAGVVNDDAAAAVRWALGVRLDWRPPSFAAPGLGGAALDVLVTCGVPSHGGPEEPSVPGVSNPGFPRLQPAMNARQRLSASGFGRASTRCPEAVGPPG